MNNKTYDLLKNVNMTILPATGTAYFALSEIWGLPAGEKVVGTIAVITTFLGVLLKVVSGQYYKSDAPYDGAIVASQDEAGLTRYSLELGMDPDEIPNRSSIAFKVATPPPYVEDVTDKIVSP